MERILRPPKSAGPELVFALVAPIGAPTKAVVEQLTQSLAEVGYRVDEPIHVIQLLEDVAKAFPCWAPVIGDLSYRTEQERYERHIRAGREFSDNLETPNALAALTIARIQTLRKARTESPTVALPRWSYVVRSFKRPEEVSLFQDIYEPGFFLIAVHSSRSRRIDYLATRFAESAAAFDREPFREPAEHWVTIDEQEHHECGQNVRQTFPLADVVVDGDDPRRMIASIQRFVQLVFGHSGHTPSRDEVALAVAQHCALRSASLSRQVGAVIVDREGEIVAAGTNELPRAGGGLCGPEDPVDYRDIARATDLTHDLRVRTLRDVLDALKKLGALNPDVDVASLLGEHSPLQKTRVMDLIEFGRAAHAEMAALCDAARRGVSVRGCTLYTTLFPCHECTRLIIAAGIAEVVYAEPYPKGLTKEMFADLISDGENTHREDVQRVLYRPFFGVKPRRYSLFAMCQKRVDKSGRVLKWHSGNKSPRVGIPGTEYMKVESLVARDLRNRLSTGPRTSDHDGEPNNP